MGDVAVSIQKVLHNAENAGISHNEELKRVLIHGILHLEGMDHETDDNDKMLIEQERVLAQCSGVRIL